MKTYAVYGMVTGSQYLGEFQAHSPEDGVNMAYHQTNGIVMLCHQCAHLCKDAEIRNLYAEEIK